MSLVPHSMQSRGWSRSQSRVKTAPDLYSSKCIQHFCVRFLPLRAARPSPCSGLRRGYEIQLPSLRCAPFPLFLLRRFRLKCLRPGVTRLTRAASAWERLNRGLRACVGRPRPVPRRGGVRWPARPTASFKQKPKRLVKPVFFPFTCTGSAADLGVRGTAAYRRSLCTSGRPVRLTGPYSRPARSRVQGTKQTRRGRGDLEANGAYARPSCRSRRSMASRTSSE